MMYLCNREWQEIDNSLKKFICKTKILILNKVLYKNTSNLIFRILAVPGNPLLIRISKAMAIEKVF